VPTSEPDAVEAAEQAALVDALAQTSFVTMAVLSRVAAEHDLSLTQLRTLAILRDRRLRMTQLATFLGLDKSTMTGLVDRAQRRGLVHRARSLDDGRATDVFLSADGLALATSIQAQVAQALAPMIGRLNRSDARRLHSLLAGILDSP
jgi:DNA-binding MarR family transcriptional regulator